MAEAATEKGNNVVLKYDSEEDVAVALAPYVARLSEKFIKEKGYFNVVLSGGTLIQTMRKLVEPPFKFAIDWSKWNIFWLDERVVPLDDPDSNYKLAYDGFLSKVPIPAENIYPINDKVLTPEYVANLYWDSLKQLVAKKTLPSTGPGGFPIFDLMLLGMGPDGHVASLFPNRTQKYEKKKWVTYITDSPKPPPPRITFTFPVINSSSEVALVVTGAELADAVKIALETDSVDPPLPVEMVSPKDLLTWFLDQDAASKL